MPPSVPLPHPHKSGPDRARPWTRNQKSEVVQTLAKSLAAFCRYCQSIHVPRLFMTLSWIFSWIRWYVCASSCKLLLWFSHYRVQKKETAIGVLGRYRGPHRSSKQTPWLEGHGHSFTQLMGPEC